ATLLTYFYAIPGRLVAKVWFWLNYVVFAVLAGFGLGAAGGALGGRTGAQAAGCLIGPIVRLFPIMWMLFLAWALYSIHPALLLLFAIPYVLAWFGRYGEKYADRVAADLGYGQPLIEVLYGWLNAGHDAARKQQGWRANLFSTHPSCASRIQALEKRLYGRTQIGGSA
ncbi:MAG TPA: M48 family metalloprotease, partial [Nocardioides sp.]|uniref:M48 family metalloprotease n=1 Tax=Nocardioides sp. TaxID=35761 RepID=UPI002EDB6937